MTAAYDQAVAGLIRDLGLDRLPRERQDDLLEKMGEILVKRVFIETMEALGEAGMEEYEKLMDSGPDQGEVERFFAGRIPGYEEMVAGIVERFKEEMRQAAV
jgi:hypothetical protein